METRSGKNLVTVLLCALMSVAMLSLTGCKDRKVYRIGVSQCSDDDWRSKMNDEIRREMIFHDNAEVEIRSADDSNDKQIADIRYFADNGFDIIIAAPNEANALTPVIKEVYESGIPVLIFDRNINGDYYTAFQGTDNRGIGRSAARLARSLVDGECNVVEIRGLEGSTPAEDRHSGFHEVIAKAPHMRILAEGYGNWNGDDATQVADSLLRLNPDANLIYAHNDRMAIAASRVARSMGRDDIKIIGIDAAPEIGIQAVADSVIDATFLYPTEGYGLIRTAMAILEGKPYRKETILPMASVVDLSNAGILLRQNVELKNETSKISWLKGKVDDYWSRHSAQTSLLYAAITILVLLFILVFVLLRIFWVRKQHQKKLAEQNRMLAIQRDQLIALNEQLQDATQSKLMFFTNVSHDLRTPLTLIAGPVEQLSEADNLTPSQQSVVKIANKNVKILKRLINQILDFRKYENGKLDISLTEVDLGSMMPEWCESFRNIATERDIHFSVNVESGCDLTTAVDIEKIERVMFNLISNAFKYTDPNDSITVTVRKDAGNIVIRVADTGKGISTEDLSHIFERFFQVDKIHPNGSGIGLSLAKAFIELHGGSITADSRVGEGSTFTVTLPVKHVDTAGAVTTGSRITPEVVNMELEDIAVPPAEIDRDRTTVLVIDDNPDIRNLIASILDSHYAVITASNGIKGLKMAAKYVPDLIICDVMMPLMDGMECCRRLKSEQPTSHIPVLMLTACSMDEQRIQGYECGADAYLSKPFNAGVLLARCKSLIDNRLRIRASFSASGPVVPSSHPAEATSAQPGGTISEIDNDFYRRFCEIVETEMSNQDLTVDNIAQRMGLGRTQFYRKIKALTNYSPVELLRNMRLAKARTLLTATDKSVSEIAYEVGFSTPAYFGKCYKDRYNETPTDIRERLK